MKSQRHPRNALGAPAIWLCVSALSCCLGVGALAAQTRAAELKAGAYRVVLQSPGGDLPFELDVANAQDGWRAYLVPELP